MTSRLSAGLVVGALVLSVGLSGCTSTQSVGGEKDGKYTDSSGTITIIDASRRTEPVELSAPTLDGKQVDLATLRGNPAVLNVWYSSCPPCRKEAPDLVAAYDQLNPQGVGFLGINIKQGGDAQALAFQRSFKIPYPSLADDGGKTLLAFRGEISPNVVPTTLVLDAEGRVAARISGLTTKNTLLGVVDAVKTGKVFVSVSPPPSSAASADAGAGSGASSSAAPSASAQATS